MQSVPIQSFRYATIRFLFSTHIPVVRAGAQYSILEPLEDGEPNRKTHLEEVEMQ